METCNAKLFPLSFPPNPKLNNHLLAAATTISHLRQIHAVLLKSNGPHLPAPFLSRLLSLSHPASLRYALAVFRLVPDPPASLSNRLLKALSRSADPRAALVAYRHIRSKCLALDRFSLPPLLKAGGRVAGEEGMELHGFVVKLGFDVDPFVQTGLVGWYAASSRVEDARKVFDRMSHRDVVAWSVMFDGYLRAALYGDILLLFDEMRSSGVKADSVVLVPVLAACGRMGNLAVGCEVHSYVSDNDVVIDEHLQGALVSMYANCGSMDLAQSLFDEVSSPKNVVACTALVSGYAKVGKVEVARAIFDSMPEKDLVAWSAMISGYAESDQPSEALALFEKMREFGVKPDRITMLSVISACGYVGMLNHAIWIYDYVDRNGFSSVTSVSNALIIMFSKCGSLERAHDVFEKVPRKNVITWTSMITGLAMHGDGVGALELFERMQTNGIEPNGVTFISLLYACAHSGLVDDGRRIFNSMVHDHEIEPQLEHYGCIVDLLGRANLLEQVSNVIKTMPFSPNVVIWGSLLGACRVHGNMELGEYAAKQILRLDPDHDGAHVLLSNIYAKNKRWNDVKAIRNLMKYRGVLKEKGCSWIEFAGKLHQFAMGDCSHPQYGEVYAYLDVIVKELEKVGYMPDTHNVMVDMEEDEKKIAILLHGEKLALSFGLINLEEGSCIRIMKNLRVCEDCHSFMKTASLVFSREIVLRDRTRFHHFKGGMCSCKDFW